MWSVDFVLQSLSLSSFIEFRMSGIGHACIPVSLDDRTWPPSELKDLELGQLEVKHGLLQLAETVEYFQKKAHALHRAISAESVYITSSGAWNLADFNSLSAWTNEGLIKLVALLFISRTMMWML